jgi:hypothetical protein
MADVLDDILERIVAEQDAALAAEEMKAEQR